MDGVLHPQNHALRKAAKSTFKQDLYKLLNNSVFGKTMENLRKRVDVKLVWPPEADKLRNLVAKPIFNHSVMFGVAGDLAAGHIHKSRLLLHRPVCVGKMSSTFRSH